MKVFISYAKDNEDLAVVVREYLKSVNESLDICLSSDSKVDRVGKRYVDGLRRNLDDADLFIPILTKEFFASRFCVMEFGAAVFLLFDKYKYEATEFIYPLCVYPFSPDNALKYTLIAHLAAYNIMDEDDIKELSQKLKGSETEINARIKDYLFDVKRLVYGNPDLLQIATEIKGFAWGGCAEGTSGVDNERFCKVWINEEGISTGFKLSPGGFENEKENKPDFGTFLIFRDTVNIDAFLSLSKEARLVFELDCFTNSFDKFTVEFKSEGNSVKAGEITFKIEAECATYEVPLSIIKGKDACKAISEINFIVLGEDTVEDEGQFFIRNLTIKTE